MHRRRDDDDDDHHWRRRGGDDDSPRHGFGRAQRRDYRGDGRDDGRWKRGRRDGRRPSYGRRRHDDHRHHDSHKRRESSDRHRGGGQGPKMEHLMSLEHYVRRHRGDHWSPAEAQRRYADYERDWKRRAARVFVRELRDWDADMERFHPTLRSKLFQERQEIARDAAQAWVSGQHSYDWDEEVVNDARLYEFSSNTFQPVVAAEPGEAASHGTGDDATTPATTDTTDTTESTTADGAVASNAVSVEAATAAPGRDRIDGRTLFIPRLPRGVTRQQLWESVSSALNGGTPQRMVIHNGRVRMSFDNVESVQRVSAALSEGELGLAGHRVNVQPCISMPTRARIAPSVTSTLDRMRQDLCTAERLCAALDVLYDVSNNHNLVRPEVRNQAEQRLVVQSVFSASEEELKKAGVEEVTDKAASGTAQKGEDAKEACAAAPDRNAESGDMREDGEGEEEGQGGGTPDAANGDKDEVDEGAKVADDVPVTAKDAIEQKDTSSMDVGIPDEADGMSWENVRSRLDSLLSYLRNVYCVCFYCGHMFDSTLQMGWECGFTHVRGKPTTPEPTEDGEVPADPSGSAAASGGGSSTLSLADTVWVSTNEQRLNSLLKSFQERPIDARAAVDQCGRKFEHKHTRQEAPERFRCSLCGKAFCGAHFVHKHISLRHEEDYAASLDEEMKAITLENVLQDPTEAYLRKFRKFMPNNNSHDGRNHGSPVQPTPLPHTPTAATPSPRGDLPRTPMPTLPASFGSAPHGGGLLPHPPMSALPPPRPASADRMKGPSGRTIVHYEDVDAMDNSLPTINWG